MYAKFQIAYKVYLSGAFSSILDAYSSRIFTHASIEHHKITGDYLMTLRRKILQSEVLQTFTPLSRRSRSDLC